MVEPQHGTRTAARVVAAAVATVAMLAGCGGQPPAGPAAAEAVSGGHATPAERLTASPAPSPSRTRTGPARVSRPALTVPATTAGPLDARSVPGPPALGPGWRRYVDPGQPEAGYLGNGSWVRSRDAPDVVSSVVPLGCRGLTSSPRLPVPRHALEATYRGPHGAPAVALALDFATSRDARTFVAMFAAIARSCPAPPTTSADQPLTTVILPVRVSGVTVLDRRRELGRGAGPYVWSEAVVEQGRRVGLLIVASSIGAARPDLRDLAARLRHSVSR